MKGALVARTLWGKKGDSCIAAFGLGKKMQLQLHVVAFVCSWAQGHPYNFIYKSVFQNIKLITPYVAWKVVRVGWMEVKWM